MATKKTKVISKALPIYNCHIHTFTNQYVPRHFLKMFLGPVLGVLLSELLRWRPLARALIPILKRAMRGPNRDAFDRYAHFMGTGMQPSQRDIFKEIEDQYPEGTRFVVLAVDMTYMKLGRLEKTIDQQHESLLRLSKSKEGRNIIPFYAVDPRHEDILQKVKTNLGEGKFRGIKIYPNMGYPPYDECLMQVYRVCAERNVPVIAHCTPSGVYRYGVDEAERRRLSRPENYKKIYEDKKLKDLRICLAHFGGAEEWEKHIKSRDEGPNAAWVWQIAEMMRSGDYPNLYTDISYTSFTPRQRGLYIDLYDYLKVLLQDERIRTHVLFGSDYYMVEREAMTEKEVSIALRSRLGEDLYFQIAYHNPRKFLGIQ